MGSPFKMNPKTPLMKALTGKQGNLPQQLQMQSKLHQNHQLGRQTNLLM